MRNDAHQLRNSPKVVLHELQLASPLQDVDIEKAYSVLREHTLHVIVGLRGGCLEDVFLFIDEKKANEKRKSMLKDYELTDKDKPDNAHSRKCRWNSENELHLHQVEVE